ncbi:hypothetical protein AAHA92_32465 [Salvia divinorum]|uniref:Pentatricopeptide repeat-containing protein n=1 Tax=Salvia divinorum TaxID=28513 RepID=A0ABD1FLA3_SALDI
MNFRRYLATAAAAARHRRHLSAEPIYSIPIPPFLKRNPPHPPTQPPPLNPNTDDQTSACISEILQSPALQPGPDLEEALTAAKINPTPAHLLGIFKKFDSSPKPLFTLFNWARKRPGYRVSMDVFNAMVDSLGKAREFDSAWCVILDQIEGDPNERPNFDTYVIMIRRYARAGLPLAAIRTYEYICSLDSFHDSDPGKNLLVTLLDSLCKEKHVRIASKYLDTITDPSWLPSVRIYNILLNGWLRIGKLKHAERIRVQMKKAGIKANVVTYGTLVEGLCQMSRPDIAIELVDEMRAEEVEPNAIVYNSIIDALGEAGRLKEAMGMLERFSILEMGPTLSTYNSLVKGFCKAGDLVEASKIVKMMMNYKCLPSTTTDERVDLATKMIKEMRDRGIDLDLAASTMLIHLLWKLQRYDEAVFEFVDMLRRGIVPQHLTYQRMSEDLERRGMFKTAHKLHDLMASVPRSTKVPNTYKGSHEWKTSVIKRAESMSQILKTRKTPSELGMNRYQPESAVLSAQRLIDHIQRKASFKETNIVRHTPNHNHLL